MTNEIRLNVNNDDVQADNENNLFHEIFEVYEKQPSGRLDPDNKERPQTKIQRVPEIMLQYKNFKESYYKPREVSIGPIHANTSNLSNRELKMKLTAKFMNRSSKRPENLLKEIKADVDELKKCFDEKVIEDYDDQRLIQLVFLDGCFLLQFVESYLSGSLKDFNITNGKAAVISNDLFLAENQIPFRVLRLLMDSCDQKIQERKNVLIFVGMNIPIGNRNYIRDLLEQDNSFSPFRVPPCSTLNHLLDVPDRVHLLDLLREVQLFGDQKISENKDERESVSRASRNKQLSRITISSFRDVQDLKLAGITLMPSRSCSLKAVSFSTKCFISGQLKLPTLIVDDSTELKLLNLVAYEMCLDDHETNCSVTSYLNFLDLLIDNEQDVKDLRAACILRNRLSSDAEVAQLFNSIGYCCRTAPKDDYLKIKTEIQRHYQRKTAIWMAQVYNEQFKSPWTVIALLAASIILILTATQTWYTVNPKKD